ncbi:uncharacterized protein PV06_10183 [Exophiala oligosperma]|uniref:Xylanolytic transcriptional activator regulatory domain-containing protein n=1 Tax=Exophiala oligosperma TaxID=215243 RepID=A0A0D2D2L1_9EURO|nr:uncharacterized protein PV06_10183 [Exophiala oligosperma]KIW37533.1 hypothetical protein PV06_10183 [Exophiala oligosperma]
MHTFHTSLQSPTRKFSPQGLKLQANQEFNSDTLLRHLKDHSDAASNHDNQDKPHHRSSISVEPDSIITTASMQQPVSTTEMSLSAPSVSSEPQSLSINGMGGSHMNLPVSNFGSHSNSDYQNTTVPQQQQQQQQQDGYSGHFISEPLPNNFDPSLDALDFEAQFPSWIVPTDLEFHTGILDTPLATSMAELRPGWPDSPFTTFGSSTYKPVDNMQHLWFTPNDEGQEEVLPSGPATPPASHVEVDDSYRQTLHQSLLIRSVEQSLPSSDFLNLCVRSYFAKFHPVFPVVHAPTFRPSKANSMVLLSICSVGSLFTGSAHAIRQGVQIFERLHKAVLANWDRLISRGTDEKISLIQTAIIGQTFGLLSGEPRHLSIVDTFNGTLISWARRLSTFKTKKMRGLELLSLGPAELEKQWREWAKNEELIRIALAVHIHDAELASIFHHEPFLRHNSRQLPVAASNQMFMASKAEEWRQAYLDDPSNFEMDDSTPASVDAHVDFDMLSTPQASYFTAYTVLEGICVNIVENRIDSRSSPATMKDLSHLLNTFFNRFLLGTGTSSWKPDHMDMIILWHLAYMSICADFDLLERAIGRDGSQLSAEDRVAITHWADSNDAKRCVIHGSIIAKKLEDLPLGSEPAIHVPRAMFRAGIAWFCYTRFGTRGGGAGDGTGNNGNNNKAVTTSESLDFPEFRLLGVNPALLLFQVNGYKHGLPTTAEINAALCGLTDLLRRIGHWEIARRFAAILGALLHNDSD